MDLLKRSLLAEPYFPAGSFKKIHYDALYSGVLLNLLVAQRFLIEDLGNGSTGSLTRSITRMSILHDREVVFARKVQRLLSQLFLKLQILAVVGHLQQQVARVAVAKRAIRGQVCLLYTSDAADE